MAIAMAGGYADDVDDVVDIHATTVALALERVLAQAASEAAAEC